MTVLYFIDGNIYITAVNINCIEEQEEKICLKIQMIMLTLIMM